MMHRILAERPTLNVMKRRYWEDVLSAFVFPSSNIVNASSTYTPFEIVFGHRPKFLLSDLAFGDLPLDCHAYIGKHTTQLLDRVIAFTNPLAISSGDYVYLKNDAKGPGRKCQSKYSGQYILTKLSSPHIVILQNPELASVPLNLYTWIALKCLMSISSIPQTIF